MPLLFALVMLPCALMAQGQTGKSLEELKSVVIAHYADILEAEYQDSLQLTRQLQTNIETFLTNPDAGNLAAAKQAWILCRQPYSQSEIARFYDGPIENIEGFINAWPIDLAYVDYTAGSPDTGIINNVTDYPQITRDVLVGANEHEGEKNVSTGFHAIEFLLWGQDLYADSPGRRPYTDYVDVADGPGRNAARRRVYLRLLAQLLVQHLEILTSQWSPGQPDNYRSRFVTLPAEVALAKIMAGAGNLSSSELCNERILVPYTTKSQENEQCCFSDTTHLDLLRNEMGVQDIFLGRYRRPDGTLLEGPGLLALLEQTDPKLAAKLRSQLEGAVTAIKSIPAPFDQAILGDDSAPGRVAIKKSLDALQAQNASILKAAEALHIQLNLK